MQCEFFRVHCWKTGRREHTFGSVIDLGFFIHDLSSLEIAILLNKKVVIRGKRKKTPHIKSKFTLILARGELHDHTLMFHREICLKAYKLEKEQV